MSQFNVEKLTNLSAEEQAIVTQLLGPTTSAPYAGLGVEQLFAHFKQLNDFRRSATPQSLRQLDAAGLIRHRPVVLSKAV